MGWDIPSSVGYPNARSSQELLSRQQLVAAGAGRGLLGYLLGGGQFIAEQRLSIEKFAEDCRAALRSLDMGQVPAIGY